MQPTGNPSIVIQDTPARSLATLIIAIGAGVLVVIMAWAVLAAALGIDAASRSREERLVSNGLRIHADDVRRSLTPNDVWDEAVTHLDVHFDPAWAKSFIGEDLWHTDGYRHIFVLDRLDAPIFAYEFGRTTSAARYGSFDAGARPLVRQIRAREVARSSFRPGETVQPDAIGASAFARIGSQVFLLTASLVQPDHTNGATPSARAPIVVIAEPVDATFLDRMGHRYLVSGLRLAAPGAGSRRLAAASLVSADGVLVGRLVWRSHDPLADLLATIGPPLATSLLVLAAAVALLFRHEQRRRRDLWRAMRQARQASDAKSAFLATMSHEIRTPLNGVLGMAQAMEGEALSPIQKERLSVIRESGVALLEILSDALDISKIESGKLELESVDFDLAALIGGAVAAFSGTAAGKGVALHDLIDPAAAGLWRGDPTRARQIVHNLVSNAIKFTHDGEVRVHLDATETGLRIVVSDTGIGIAPDKIGSLFEKFVQVDSSTTRRFGGAGLGLAISRELCAAMGGSIGAESQPGEGSTFTVLLPLAHVATDTSAQTPAPIEPQARPDGRSLRVLAAEDNTVNRLVLQTLLAQLGVEPTIVTNGAEAVEAFGRAGWDLILMDVQMPVMDGLQATRQIRALEAARGATPTCIIALTANAMAHQTADYIAAGMDGSLGKPIEIARLYEIITASDVATRRAAAA